MNARDEIVAAAKANGWTWKGRDDSTSMRFTRRSRYVEVIFDLNGRATYAHTQKQFFHTDKRAKVLAELTR